MLQNPVPNGYDMTMLRWVNFMRFLFADPYASFAAFSGLHAGTAVRGPSLVDGFNPSHDG
jgi:hypothetical protein